MSKLSILHDRDKLEYACKTNPSIKEAIESMGLRAAGGNYNTFKKYCKLYSIVPPKYDYIEPMSNLHRNNRIPDREIFIENSTYKCRRSIKKRLVALGIEYKCSLCPVRDEWNGQSITLQLDHINGVYNDNRIENLRFLCPNCHSQTETFSGRTSNKQNHHKKYYYKKTCECGGIKSTKAKMCRSCANKNIKRKTKISWPSDEQLLEMVRKSSKLQVSKELGVSETAVRKRLKKNQQQEVVLPLDDARI